MSRKGYNGFYHNTLEAKLAYLSLMRELERTFLRKEFYMFMAIMYILIAIVVLKW